MKGISCFINGVYSVLYLYMYFYFDEQSAQILTTLPGHKAVVNCTQWVLTNKDVHKGFDILFTFYKFMILVCFLNLTDVICFLSIT